MNTYSVAAQLKAVGADKFASDFKNAANSVKSFAEDNARAFDAMRKGGAIAMAGGLAIGAGLGVAVKTAANFEASMSQVKAISGATGSDFESLRDKAIAMGNSTKFSASESADAMANLAQMGWKTDEIMGGIEHTLNLAAAGGLELADSAMITANTMNQFGLEAGEAERIADVFAFTASNAGTDVQQMGDAMQYAGANAAAAGMSIEDTSAFIGVLGDAGITGSKAGTSLNSMLRDLKKNSEDGAIAVGNQSVALYDAEGNMRNMPDVIGDIIRSTEGMSNEQRDAALSTIFGDQALVGFNAIAGKGADSVADLAKELYDSKGAAADMAAIMEDNLNGALTELSSAFEGVKIAIGTALIPIIRKAAEQLKKLADWFNALSTSTKDNIAIFLAISAVILTVGGGLLLLVGMLPFLINGFASFNLVLGLAKKAMLLFNSAILMNPIAWLAVAIVAAAALIYVYWEPISEFFVNLWNSVKEISLSVWESIKESWSESIEFFKEIWSTVSEFFMPIWEAIKEIFLSVWEPIKEAWNEVISFIMELWQPISQFFSEIWTEITEIFSIAWELITTIFQAAWSLIQPIVQAGMTVISTLISTYFNIITTVISSAWNVIKTIFTSALNIIKPIVTSAFNVIKTIISSVMNVISAVITTVWNVIKTIITTVLDVIMTVVRTAFEVIKTIIQTVLSVVKALVSGDFNEMKSIISTVTSAISSIISTVWNAILSIITSVLSAIKSIVSSVWSGILSVISSVANGIRSVVTSVFNAISSVISSIMSSISSTISSVWNAISSTVSSVVNAIRSVVSSVFNALSGIVTGAMSGVKSAITSGMNAALNVVTNIGGKFKEAGSKIVSMIADGIKAAAGKVTGAAKDLMGKVRNFLPFSPAKEGPLRDLHKLNFGGTIADSIDRGQSTAVKAMNNMMENVRGVGEPGISLDAGLNVGNKVASINSQAERQLSHTFDSSINVNNKQPAYINVSIANRDFEGFVEDISEVQDRKTMLEKAFS